MNQKVIIGVIAVIAGVIIYKNFIQKPKEKGNLVAPDTSAKPNVMPSSTVKPVETNILVR